MPVTIKECVTNKDFKTFVIFPFQLYKNVKNWVPPLIKDELKALDQSTNPAIQDCETCFWIALNDNKIVGRIGGFINRKYNSMTGENLCRITRIEFIDDNAVSKALFDKAEDWAKKKKMDGIHGPLGFTNLDHQAVLIEGFDYLPSISSEYHLPYYKSHFEEAGYIKESDWVEFRLELKKDIPEKALRLNDMLQKRYNLKVIHFTSKAELKDYGNRIFGLLNQAFKSLFSFITISKETSDYYIDKYLGLLNPEYVKVIEDPHSCVIGFIICVPSLSEAMQKAKGRLYPFGWYYIMKSLKRPKVADILLTAIHPDWQSQGISAVLITEMQKVMKKKGIEHVETTGIIETNDKAINHWKNYDHIQHKRKRCFRKMFI